MHTEAENLHELIIAVKIRKLKSEVKIMKKEYATFEELRKEFDVVVFRNDIYSMCQELINDLRRDMETKTCDMPSFPRKLHQRIRSAEPLPR